VKSAINYILLILPVPHEIGFRRNLLRGYLVKK
jgi:hypothetical protein